MRCRRPGASRAAGGAVPVFEQLQGRHREMDDGAADCLSPG